MLRNPEPTGVVIGPLSATLEERIDSRVSSGKRSPCSAKAADPATRSTQPIPGTAVSSTSLAADDTSGPMPSPGISVTRCRPVTGAPYRRSLARSERRRLSDSEGGPTCWGISGLVSRRHRDRARALDEPPDGSAPADRVIELEPDPRAIRARHQPPPIRDLAEEVRAPPLRRRPAELAEPAEDGAGPVVSDLHPHRATGREHLDGYAVILGERVEIFHAGEELVDELRGTIEEGGGSALEDPCQGIPRIAGRRWARGEEELRRSAIDHLSITYGSKDEVVNSRATHLDDVGERGRLSPRVPRGQAEFWVREKS